MSSDLSEIISAASPNFSKGQRRIVEYITEHPEEAAYMTAAQLGRVAGVSESTVVRFALELGFSGYPELHRAMQESLQKNLTSVQRVRVSNDRLPDEKLLDAVLERDIAQIETINEKVRANLDRQKAEIDAEEYVQQYSNLTADIDRIRKAKRDLLTNAELPLDGLTVENGELLYKGYKWDNMSSSDQLIVASSIVRKLNPNCGFVLLDKLEQMDLDTLNDFGQWLEKEGLQAIATRVSTGDECSIIIEDGMAVGNELPQAKIQPQNEDRPKWKAGVF